MPRRKVPAPSLEERLNALLEELAPELAAALQRLWTEQARELSAAVLERIAASDEVPAAILDDLERSYRVWLDEHLAEPATRVAEDSSEQLLGGLAEIGIGVGAAAALAAIAVGIARRLASRRAEWTRRQAEAWAEARRAELEPAQRRDLLRAVVGLSGQQARGLRTLAERLARDAEFSEARARAALQRAADGYRRTRAVRLATTEITDAYKVGVLATAEVATDGGSVEAWKEWNAQIDERTCRVCGALHGVVRRLADPFPGGFDGPPAHPHCRCGMDVWVEVT